MNTLFYQIHLLIPSMSEVLSLLRVSHRLFRFCRPVCV